METIFQLTRDHTPSSAACEFRDALVKSLEQKSSDAAISEKNSDSVKWKLHYHTLANEYTRLARWVADIHVKVLTET